MLCNSAGRGLLFGGIALGLILLLAAVSTLLIGCRLMTKWKSRTSSEVTQHITYGLPSPGVMYSESFDSNSTSPHLHSLTSDSSQSEGDKVSLDVEALSALRTQPSQLAAGPEETRVAIVGSLRISTKTLVEYVAAPLVAADERLHVSMYDVCVSDRADETHARLTPSQWVERTLERTDFVVCVCNKEFMEDWNYEHVQNGNAMCREASFVKRIRCSVSGQMNYSQLDEVRRKFVIVVLQERDSQFIPECLKDCNSFKLNCAENYEKLIRHLLGIPAVRLEQRLQSVEIQK